MTPDLLDIEGPPGPPIEKVFDFYATTIGGLESLAVDDMRKQLRGLRDVQVQRRRRQSRIHFRYERSPRHLLALNGVEHIFARLGEAENVTVGTPGLLRLAERVAAADITPAVALHDVLHGPKEFVGFRVTCTVGKGHRFSASELQHVLTTVIAAKYGLDDEELDGPYNIHVQVEGHRALAGFRLTTGSLGSRDYLVAPVRGDVPGVVGYALAHAARVRKGETWVDPWCRGGVILIEAARLRPDGRYLGGDPDGEAVGRATVNGGTSGAPVHWMWWDGVLPPVREGSVDGVVTNLQHHGRQVLFDALDEIQRMLTPSGTAVVLMERDRDTETFLGDETVLTTVNRRPVHIHGRHPSIYVLKKHA